MSDDKAVELYRGHRDSMSRYTYFLLAGAGASFAFAATQTKDATLAWSHLPLGLAILLWFASFFCGCRFLKYQAGIMRSNSELLNIEAGRSKFTGNHPLKVAAGSQAMREIIEEESAKAGRYSTLQFNLLIAGAILYAVWHILEMWLRTQGG